jgi:tungstate transport system substrate-binding protein
MRTGMRTRLVCAICAVLSTAALAIAPAASGSNLVVQGTTDVRDAGLLSDVIVPGFQLAYPQYNLQYIAVGSGAALNAARAGNGDAVLTHAPTLEKSFDTDGFSLEPTGRAIFYSDYVILGPNSDPAGVFSGSPHDAVTAFEKIAAAGNLGNAKFYSRGDNSGTNVQEKLIWGLTNSSVVKNSNSEPGDGTATGNPPWYSKGPGAVGQAQGVRNAAALGAYTMTDRGTFNNLVTSSDPATSLLKLVADKNAASARGGLNLLTNPFTVYAVNPAKNPNVNVAGAQAFITYLTSRQFQQRIINYPSVTQPAFFPDARPSITLTAPKKKGKNRAAATAKGGLPKRADKGDKLKVSGTVSNLLPGSPPLANDPIILERVIKAKKGKGKVYKRVKQAKTNATGGFKIKFSAKKTAKLRLRFPITYPDLNVNPLLAVGSLQEQTLGLGSLKVNG